MVPQRSVPAPGVSFSEMETPTFNTYYVYHVYIYIYSIHECFYINVFTPEFTKIEEKKAEPEKIS